VFGWLILLIVVQLGSYGLNFLSIKFNLGLMTPWFHTNAFLIGGINWFYTINLALIVGAYYLLVRFDLIPRDMFSATRSQAATVRAQTDQPGKASPDGMGKSRRTRAARRHAASNPPSVTTSASTRRTTTTKARVVTPPPPTSAPTGHDEEYYRVKAAQRQLRRREAKR
jgi:hypothetical protein